MDKKCNCYKKPPFPTMSAHFAHTLDDMEEKYVKLHFIDISESSGTLDKEKLDNLILSRENKIVFENCIYTLTTIDEDLYTYISTRVQEEGYLEFNKLVLNKITGDYSISVIKSKDGQIIENLAYDVSKMKENLDQMTATINTLQAQVNKKIEVAIEPDPIDQENITLKLF